MNDSKYGFIVIYQGNIDGKLSIPIDEKVKHKLWLSPADCLANVTEPLYKPVIKFNSNNSVEWKYLETYEYNQEYLNSI